MRKSLIIAAAAVAAAGIALGGTALTGAGLTSNAPATAFIGGTVNQTVTGATLESIDYGFVDPGKTQLNLVTLTFAAGIATEVPTVVLSGGAAGQPDFTCTAVDEETNVSTCAPATGSYTGLAGIAVTVG